MSGPAGGATPLPPVGDAQIGDAQTFTDEQAAALVAAGRLLQRGGKGGWPGGRKKIERLPGETYPAAVARVVAGLSIGERQHLRELVSWVRAYEQHDC